MPTRLVEQGGIELVDDVTQSGEHQQSGEEGLLLRRRNMMDDR
jgi:hypothetical protein